jgi:c(7)-type cytochrome triheme protein
MKRGACSIALIVALWLDTTGASAQWSRLRDDGVHDPKSPAVKDKQEPGAALSALAEKAPDPGVGNQVRWVRALESGVIAPRTNLWPDTKIRILDLDIYLDIGGSMPVVRFPHKAHTMWLDCSNCHDEVFRSVAGETPISMLQILEGEQCGICHGAVAFPLTECARCHSVQQNEFSPLEKRLGLTRLGPKRNVAR